MHVFFNNSLFSHSFCSCPHGLVEGVVKQKVDRRGQGKGGGVENWQKNTSFMDDFSYKNIEFGDCRVWNIDSDERYLTTIHSL